MDTASKLQDPRATARWHNIWLGTALFFLVTTVTFAGVFGWAFTQWKEDDTCHEYHANLVHLPPGNFTPMTTLLFHDGEVYFRKGAAYDASSCEGKLVNQLIKKGNVLDVETSGGRRLQTDTTTTVAGTTFTSYPSKFCKCNTTHTFKKTYAGGYYTAPSASSGARCYGNVYSGSADYPGLHCGSTLSGASYTLYCDEGLGTWVKLECSLNWYYCQAYH
jgi:hypothetical protein